MVKIPDPDPNTDYKLLHKVKKRQACEPPQSTYVLVPSFDMLYLDEEGEERKGGDEQLALLLQGGMGQQGLQAVLNQGLLHKTRQV